MIEGEGGRALVDSDDGQATHGTRFTQLQAPGGKTLHAACLIWIDDDVTWGPGELWSR